MCGGRRRGRPVPGVGDPRHRVVLLQQHNPAVREGRTLHLHGGAGGGGRVHEGHEEGLGGVRGSSTLPSDADVVDKLQVCFCV